MNGNNLFDGSLEAAGILINGNSTISNTIDLNSFVDYAFDQINSTTVHRAEFYNLLADHIRLATSTKINSIIDRLPTFIESASANTEESIGIQNLFRELLAHSPSDAHSVLSKNINKIVNVACKIALHRNANHGLLILEILGKSSLRAMLSPAVKQVQLVCLQLIDDFDVNENLLASVLGLFLSIESSEVWSSSWLRFVNECYRTLAILNIVNHENTNKSIFLDQLKGNTLHGCDKTIYFKNIFRRLCSFLIQVIIYLLLFLKYILFF
jgi:hypothetical protein